MDKPIVGGCLCGAIRYESTEPPQISGACHCRMCQKWTGAASAMTVAFDTEHFRFSQGTPKMFMASAVLERHFCGECGSSLMHRYVVPPYGPNLARVGIGTLDDRTCVEDPKFHFGIESRIGGWVCVDEDRAAVVPAEGDSGLEQAWREIGRPIPKFDV